jgi:leucyl-tRNA synthetase, eubacterial and mitochondrial family
VEGTCERCGTEVTKKDLTQWFLKITEYAEELLEKLDELDWPEKTKMMQRNWIGKSDGAEIEFKVDGKDISFKVFTTRADTLYGVTYVVLAPENEIVDQITTDEHRRNVEDYKEYARKQSEIERLSTEKEKTGVFTGAYAIHPITGEKVPIWISDYVLATYGTGCVMAVPAHDERDYAFAKKYDLPIKRVIKGKDGEDDSLPFVEYGILVDSGDFTGMSSEDARLEIVKMLEKEGKGSLKVNYRLRDWLVSRQRYWGAPIPIIHCEKCGLVPVPEEDLPVLLPYNVEFSPDGESPLKKSEEFMNTTCPKCGGKALRDPDTLDTFVDSSWYFLRYPDNKNDKEPFNKELIDKMLPVDKYIGGAEHACMHLLYARFVTKALRDLGYLDFDEPFKSLIHQGIILGPDGNKMSKSRGNTISPDEYINEYGSDVFRMYLMFGFAFTEGGPWNDDGIKAMFRFIQRIERLVDKFIEDRGKEGKDEISKDEKELNYVRNYTIKSVTEDAEKFQFNTAIARIMELVNALYKYDADVEIKNTRLYEETIADLVRLLAPFAPHFAEEMWDRLGYTYSVFNQKWPEYDEKALVKDTVEIAIQVNGKVRGRIEISSDAAEKEIQDKALSCDNIRQFIDGKEIKKVIVVKNRLVNIVVK